MLKFGTPTIALPLAIKKCTVQTGCTVYMCVQKKIVIERTRDIIYLKFVGTDFFQKIISPSAGENSGDFFALLMNPLPDRSNYLPL